MPLLMIAPIPCVKRTPTPRPLMGAPFPRGEHGYGHEHEGQGQGEGEHDQMV
jgi:hypothetical protein